MFTAQMAIPSCTKFAQKAIIPATQSKIAIKLVKLAINFFHSGSCFALAKTFFPYVCCKVCTSSIVKPACSVFNSFNASSTDN